MQDPLDCSGSGHSSTTSTKTSKATSITSENNGKTESKETNGKRTCAMKWRSWLLWWNTEEWWACWIGLIFFGCVVAAVKDGVPQPQFLLWDTNPFLTFDTMGNVVLPVLFVAMGGMLWLALASFRASHWQLFPLGYLVVFFIALISKMLANNVQLHSASIGDSIWAIIFGCVLRNLLSLKYPSQPLVPWLKVAQQTELYIAISLVLLCIDISVLRPLAPRALFVSWIDTPSLFMLVALVGWKWLRIDMQTAIILSGATFICGSSAAIALGASMGVPHKTEMPIAIISIFTIPSIIALPYIAQRLGFSADVSGAWFGGSVDSTGAVIAAASIYGDKQAIATSAVVKMMQNVLIGPISVVLAWAWSEYELRQAREHESATLLEMGSPNDRSKTPVNNDKDHRRESAVVLLWKRFPKFVLGFIITAVLFNTVIGGDADTRANVNSFSFYVSEWFSTLSFVSIGLGLQFSDMKRNMRSLGLLCTLYIFAQLIDIVVTAVLAWIAFTYI